MTDQDRLGPPPVEPMSDVEWARVERNLWSRIDSGAADRLPEAPKRRWLWLAVPTLAVAVVVAILFGSGVFSSHDSSRVISSGDSIEPSRVVAGAAPTSVSFGDAHIDLAARSAIVMSSESGSPSVLLERGVATFAVAPRANRKPFVVRAGDTVVRVVGTKFTVARSEELITVVVEHGLVDVQFRGATQRVGAGETWTSDAPTKTALAPTSPPVPDNVDPPTNPPTGPPVPDKVVVPTNPPANPPTSLPAPDKVVTPTPDKVVTPPTTGSLTTAKPPADEASEFDRLTSLEARDPKSALAGYLALSKGNTKWSAVALYAAGRLSADRKDPRAATFLDIYLRRFPRGANAADARDLLNRVKGAPR